MRPGFLAFCLLAVLTSLRGQAPLPPVISGQPEAASVYPDDVVILRVTAEGASLSYQWRREGTDLPGETGPVLMFAASLGLPRARYDVVVTNPGGSVTSLPAWVFVSPRPQTITLDLPALVVAAGSGVRLTATASSGLPVTVTLVSGAASLAGNLLTSQGGDVVVRATQAGNATYAAADPVQRTIRFLVGSLAPYLTVRLSDQSPPAGSTLTLQASAVGTPLPTFQWSRDGVAIAGATRTELTLPALTLADTGRYAVTVTNLAGSDTSAAQVMVRAAPVFTRPPGVLTVPAGEDATLTVEVTGYPVPALQWRRNGTALPGQTGATLRLAPASAAAAGAYDVVATNALGTATSAAAELTVTVRDFAGTYAGRLSGGTEGFLLVRGDGTAAVLAPLAPGGAAVALLNATVDLRGNVRGTGSTAEATPRAFTATGTLDEVAGTARITFAALNETFTATRIAAAAPVAAAGLYRLALLGSAGGRGDAFVTPEGQVLVVTSSGGAADVAAGQLDATGRLRTTSAGGAALDLTFAAGLLRGTVRAGTGTLGTLAGAVEALLGQEQLVNLSVRGLTLPNAPLIVGFATAGAAAKTVLLRAVGPGIARPPFNVAGALPDPSLQLFRVNTALAQNNNWGQPPAGASALAAAATATGAFPLAAGSADAALLAPLPAGVYTAQVSGGQGIVLAELYGVPAAGEIPGTRRFTNASTRTTVAPEAPLIAGFVISGAAPQRVLIRAVGPTLGNAPFNVPGVLANPQLNLFRGSTLVRTNDDWFRDPEANLIRQAATAVRAFSLGAQSLDAALLVYLEPGAYTAVVSGPTNAGPNAQTGNALVEIYEAQP
ncbi:MAG: immunoglobulin domain-containing protein [Opitutaceae bacterium]